MIENAPSALRTVCKLIENGIRLAIVIDTPVGFVHFLTLLDFPTPSELEISLTPSGRESLEISLTPKELKRQQNHKELLINTDIPSISNIGTRGGTPIAVACINELISILNEKILI